MQADVTGMEEVSPLPTPRIDRRYVVAALMTVMVLASMEQTVTSTAMPTVINDLHGLEHYSWVASVYLLACTVTMPLYGRLADAIGRKRVIVFAITLFCLASALAGASRGMIQLILFRALQGLGAGGIMPVVLTIAGDIFTVKERARIQGFFSAVWGTAALTGPMLGAFIVDQLGWRWIFYINLPLGVAGLGVLMWKYHDHEKAHTTDLDLPGIALLAVACGSALAAISGLGPGGWNWIYSAGLFAVAVISAALFVRNEYRASNPVLPPNLMMRRAIGPSIIGSCLLGMGFLCLDTYVPLYVQGVHGGGAKAAGIVVSAVMLTWATSGVITAPAIVRFGFRKVAVAGCSLTLVSSVALLLCAIFELPQSVLTGVLAASGLGFGPASMAYLLASQEAVSWQQRGIITSANMFFRSVGGAIGIGLLGMVFNVVIYSHVATLHSLGIDPNSLVDPHSRQNIDPAQLHQASQMIASGLLWVFVGMLGFAVLQFIVTLFLPTVKSTHAVSALEAVEAMAG